MFTLSTRIKDDDMNWSVACSANWLCHLSTVGVLVLLGLMLIAVVVLVYIVAGKK